MRSGRLNTPVTFERKAGGKDQYGHPTDDWQPVPGLVDIWANVKPITGRERWASQHVTNTATLAVTIRYRDDITPDMRIAFGNMRLEIVGPPINLDNRNRELVITCEEDSN
ncbi:SPP1 family predicted phage head-tail adaptor [Marinobacterium sp. MBR-111]|jgi:SPP1 family predicted phage head-tail adaptor|uniref:phage head closure protein n=1 Tax=Marinobacterium sp. MBR-111 TaxID=3156463 RepID=UPI00339B4C1B